MYRSLLLIAAFAMSAARAEGFRIGFVDTGQLMRDSGAAKVAQARIEQEFSMREAEFRARFAALADARARLLLAADITGEIQRENLRRGIALREREWRQARRQLDADLDRRRHEETQQLKEMIVRAVRQVAEDNRIDAVIEAVSTHALPSTSPPRSSSDWSAAPRRQRSS
jgi:outer membrane protein